MRVLVTGGAGYIGSHTAKMLAEQGHEPIVFDSLATGHEWAVRWGPLVVGDIRNPADIRAVLDSHRPEAVIHFAANAYVGESMRIPETYFVNNAAATMSLLEAIVGDGVRPFVFSSSCATYGVPETVPITEDVPQSPVNPYGESKLMVERTLQWLGEIHALPWAALRYFNAAGADLDGELGEVHDPETHLIPLAIRAAVERKPLSIFGTDYDTPDGTAVRDYVHVSDLATAHIDAVGHLVAGGASTSLNLGTGRGHSVREVIDAVSRAAGVAVPATESGRRPGDPPVLVADPSLAAATLNWSPEHSSLDTIAESAYRWALDRRARPL